MKRSKFLPWFLLAAILFALSQAPAQTPSTAWQALDALKASRGAALVQQVTQVRGESGQDQPQAWEVSTRVADGERVFVVRDGRIVADTVYSAGGGVPVDMRRLRVDSGEAFNIANRVATAAKVGFDSIDYQLAAGALGNSPLWILYLRDGAGRDVGEVEVSGEDGSVVRQSWYHPRDGNREPVVPPADPGRRAVRAVPGDGGVVGGPAIGERVGGAADRVKEGFQGIGEGVGRLFRGEETFEVSDEPRRRLPKTLGRTSGRR